MARSTEAEVEVEIRDLAAGGDGVGTLPGGKVVFAPRTAPGDRVRLAIVEDKKSFARGRLLEIIEPGPGRAEPRCALFAAGRCGGCQWLHLDLETQRRAKRAIAESALRRLIDAGLELEPVAAAAPATGWRRRARLHWFRQRGSERAVVGFTEPRSRRVAPVTECLQLAPELAAALPAIHELLAPGLHKRGEIDLLAGEGGVLVAVRGPVSRRHLEALAAADPIAGVRGRNQSLGAATLEIEPGIEARAGDFAQAGGEGNQALVELVTTWAGRPGRALELYAGAGNLTRGLARAAGEVVAVERRGGPRFEAANVTWRQSEAAAACAELAGAGEVFDLVVLDPPRRGAREAIEPLAALAPERILYVSCDPATLARDAEALGAAGYRALRARPLDLMPQTSHLELVMELAR